MVFTFLLGMLCGNMNKGPLLSVLADGRVQGWRIHENYSGKKHKDEYESVGRLCPGWLELG